MYAVIETGGKQYKVALGDKIKVEKLAVEAGASVRPRVLLVANGGDVAAGAPAAKTEVSAKVLSHGRGEKIRVFKMKRRKGYRRTIGHRQSYTEIQITAIGGEKFTGKKPAKKTSAKTAGEKTPEKTSAKKAAKKSSAKKSSAKTSAKKTTAKKSSAKTSAANATE
ncbi:MAG: LSU ribosomal protein L21p [Arenicellales bacterium IbO2]|nr:MAG: LSU ribosomal protein L21p [Arenicellales bacterium IbO2]